MHQGRSAVPEIEDYSGPFKPDLTFDDFSKEFLLKLMTVWQFAWIRMADSWYEAVSRRFGPEAANECNLESWVKVGERVNPRYTKIANIQLNTVLDSLKCLQLPLDNNIGPLYPVEYEIKNPNHVIMTMVQCRSLIMFERSAPQMIEPVCYKLEQVMLQTYLMNPKIKVIPLKLPPRKSQEEIACRWEFKMEDG
jgi:hypothetical protein